MGTKIKKVAIAGLSALLVGTLFSGLLTLKKQTALAETETPSVKHYFYDGLSYTGSDGKEREFVLAKEFYNTLYVMQRDGDFKDGKVEYSLSDILTSDQIKAWVSDGDATIPQAFSAARDAYYMDHPDLFYIDIYKLTISAAYNGNTYTAYIDSGREATLYADGEFTSEKEVETALTAYYKAIDDIAEYAKTEADKDEYGTAKKVLQARYANQYIATHTKYDDFSAASSAITTASAAQTAYGALVNEKAVCNGYSRAFKAVLDKLEIPCVVVGGYSVAKNSEGGLTSVGEAHAWNYVWFENPVDKEAKSVAVQADGGGAWYGYDVTWNSTGTNVNSYRDMGRFAMLKEHSPDGEISTSGYIVKYPELSDYGYGSRTNSDGIAHSITYTEVVDENGKTELDDAGYPLMEYWESVSYNGKGAIRLFEEDSLRLIYRRSAMGKDGLWWTPWSDIYIEIKEGAHGEEAYGDAVGYKDTGTEVSLYGNASILYSQFAVIDGSEDTGLAPDFVNPVFEIKSMYSDEVNLSDYTVSTSELFVNDRYLSYVPAPHVVESKPDHKEVCMISQSWALPGTNLMDPEYAFDITVRYTEPLGITDPAQPIGVSFTSNSQYGKRSNIYDYASFAPIGKDDKGNDIYVEIVGENNDTLHFKFLPSLMYEHNGTHYYFAFTNVGSIYKNYKADGSEYISHKAPNVLTLRFFREYIACTKCLPNGRMLLDCVAQPTLISNTDLSEVNFQDEDGKYFSAGQRSQMMLVVNKPTEAENETMNELLDQSTDINVKTEDIKSAETYEIDLQICGRYTYIPNGSYVKVALGFPEGYGPEDEGVTFKIYHYKRSADRKQIIAVEEIPCVVTQFGIVATIPSFSPFMIVAVDADKATTKNIYASVDGSGGKLNNADGKIQTLNQGDSYTYTIAPDDGYQVYKVTLNGENVTSKISEGKLTFTYEELDVNNELEIQYISNEAAARFEAKGIVDAVKIVVPLSGVVIKDKGGEVSNVPADFDLPGGFENGKSNTKGLSKEAIIAIVVVAVVVLIAGAVACTIVMKKKQSAKATAGKAKKTAKPVAKKQNTNVAKSTAVAAKPAPAPVAKPATPAAAPKTSGIAGSAATKQPAPAAAPKTSGIAGSAATKKPAATTAAPKTSGIAGSAATKPSATAAKPAAPAATKQPATSAAPKTSGIAGSAANKKTTVIDASPKSSSAKPTTKK